MEDLNLHFTGDLHAITAANNLLAALLDAHLHHGNELGIDPHSITWRRCLDMNDRSLRHVVTGLGGRTNGLPRETGFDITAASEVMAVMSIAARPARPAPPPRRDHGRDDRRRRAGHGRAARRRRCDDRPAQGRAARRTSSRRSRASRRSSTAGRSATSPRATTRSSPTASRSSSARSSSPRAASAPTWGWRSSSTSSAARAASCRRRSCSSRPPPRSSCTARRISSGTCRSCARSGSSLSSRSTSAPTTAPATRSGHATRRSRRARPRPRSATPSSAAARARPRSAARCSRRSSGPSTSASPTRTATPLDEKIRKIAALYGAAGVDFLPPARTKLAQLERQGLGELPVCMAKTHLSVSHDPALGATPTGFTLAGPRPARLHRRGLGGRTLRRHADDARPRRRARRACDRRRRRRPHGRALQPVRLSCRRERRCASSARRRSRSACPFAP